MTVAQATKLTSIIVNTLSQTLPLMFGPSLYDGEDDQSMQGQAQ